jgi:hypothetical protein
VDAGQPNLDDLMNPDLELLEQEIVTETSVPDKPELKKRLHDN